MWLCVARRPVRVEPRAEWEQMFHEAWRINRDWFYDPGMHGADWPAMRAKYEPFLDHLAHERGLSPHTVEAYGRDVDDFLRTAFVNRGLMTCSSCSFMQEIAEYPLIMFTTLLEYCYLVGDYDFVRERYAAFVDVLDFYAE